MTRSRRRHLSVLVDSELDAYIRAHAERNNISTSSVVRDALRVYFSVADPLDRGWREGFASGFSEVQRRLNELLSSLSTRPPSRGH